MGKILPEQVLTAELMQKIVHTLAEPINAHITKVKVTGVQLCEFNQTKVPEQESKSSQTSKCDEPWNDLTTRKQRALLLAGVELAEGFLDQLRKQTSMNDNAALPCCLDEVLSAVCAAPWDSVCAGRRKTESSRPFGRCGPSPLGSRHQGLGNCRIRLQYGYRY